jgi:Gas vesicle synthesis protein GvpL/GvpF
MADPKVKEKPKETIKEMSGNGLYLYGVSRAAGKKTVALKIASPGIDGKSAVNAISCGDFLCWACEIDHGSFAQELEKNLENLEWLALHSVRHQQVVGEIAAGGTIVPARFGTLFSGAAALQKNVTERRRALEKVFARITDADEWGVKVFAEKKAPAKVTEARSGKDYLRQKAAQIKQRPDRNDPELQELATALEKVASDAAASGTVSGTQPSLVWQATFLVPRSRRKQWDKALAEFVERWDGLRRIEVNGPWPPYSFVSDAE